MTKWRGKAEFLQIEAVEKVPLDVVYVLNNKDNGMLRWYCCGAESGRALVGTGSANKQNNKITVKIF
jgi:hypothetical protein